MAFFGEGKLTRSENCTTNSRTKRKSFIVVQIINRNCVFTILNISISFVASLDREAELLWAFIGTSGVFWY